LDHEEARKRLLAERAEVTGLLATTEQPSRKRATSPIRPSR